MKNTLVIILLAFLGFLPLACNRFLPVGPAPVPLEPTPTPFATPICGFTQVPSFPLTPAPAATVVEVWAPPFATASMTPIVFSASGTPQAVTPVVYPIPFNGPTTVLRTLSQFQSFFGNWVPPVDFDTQMVLIGDLPEGCSISDYITGVCEGPNQVTVDLTEELAATTGPQCFHEGISMVPIAIQKSDLPIVWQITEVR
jgi:hypothetical protein